MTFSRGDGLALRAAVRGEAQVPGLQGLARADMLLERDDLLADVDRLLDGLVRGESRVVVIQGGPGVGKSAALREIVRRAAKPKVTTLLARCAPAEADVPLGTVRQLLETLVNRYRMADPDGGDLQWLASLDPGTFDMVAAAPDEGALRELYWLAVKIATRKPLVLVVDDVQWADAASVEFLSYLLRRLHQISVLLVVGLDHREPSPRWPQLGEVVDEPSAVVWHLPALSDAGVATLCEQALGVVDRAVVDACVQLTAGVPHLVVQLLRETARHRDDGGGPLAETLQRCVPPTVGAVATARAARHGDHLVAVLRRLSVLRVPLSLDAVASVVGHPPAQLADALATLHDLSLVTVDDRVNVVPPVVKLAVRQTLSPSERHAAEAGAARALVAAGGHTDLAAMHLMDTYPAGVPEHVEVLRAAAGAAAAAGCPEAAGTFLTRALREPPPPQLRGAVLAELGTVEMRYDGPSGARYLHEALGCITDPVLHAVTALRLSHAFAVAVRTRDAVATLEQELATTQLPGDHELVRRMHAELMFVSLGDDDTHIRVLERHGLPVVDRAALAAPDAGRGTRIALAAVALHAALAGEPVGRVLDDVSLALNGNLTPGGDSSLGLLLCGLVLVWGDDLDTALRFFADAQAASLRTGSVLCASLGAWMHGMVAVRRGWLTQADELITEADRLLADPRWDRWRGAPLIARADLTVERGDVGDLLQAVSELELAGDVPKLLLADVGLARRGRMRALVGDVRRGVADLLEAGRRLGALGCVNPAVVPWRSDAAMALRLLGQHTDASRLVDEELELAERWGSPRPLAIALRRRAVLTGTDPQRRATAPVVARALEDLTTSLGLLDGCGMPLEQARSLLAAGRLHSAARRLPQARTALGEARALAMASGAGALVCRIDDALVAAGGRPRLRCGGGPAPLTAGEDRVARLAVAGRTNDEIARELFLARRTVEIHLTSVYRKLSIRGRAELSTALAALPS